MNGLLKTVVAATLIAASSAASASMFDFTYSFADGQQVTGDFTGVTTDGGQSVTNVGNFQIQLNGIAFAPVTSGGVTLGNATLQANAWSTAAGGAFVSSATPVTIYANGALNNFAVSDVDASVNTSPDYEFAYINDAVNGIYEAVAANFLQTDAFSTAEGNSTQLALDSAGVASNWKLTEVMPVPLPATLGLLASGLGFLGFRSRRRLAV